jgi:KUP system potassium uptake protein
VVLGLTATILVLLFASQRWGTSWVGGAFAPIVIVWLGLNAGVGVYNLASHGGTIFKALNPAQVVWFFQREGKAGESTGRPHHNVSDLLVQSYGDCVC